VREERVDRAVSDSVEMQLRPTFPAGTFTRVDVLGYGDDPDVEPRETAVRAFVGRAAQPADGWEDDERVLQAFMKAHEQDIRKLHHDGLLPAAAWVQIIPDSPARRAPGSALCGHAVGHRPHPRESRVRPDPGAGARDRRTQRPVLAARTA
jgi:hypothetical protein